MSCSELGGLRLPHSSLGKAPGSPEKPQPLLLPWPEVCWGLFPQQSGSRGCEPQPSPAELSPMRESGRLREGRGAVAEGAGGHPSTAQIPGAGEGCRQAGSAGGGWEPPHFAQCRRTGNNLSPTAAGQDLPHLCFCHSQEGDLLPMNCIPGGYICFLVSVWCVGVSFSLLPFPVLSLAKRRLRRKARAGLQQEVFVHGDERSSFFLSVVYIPALLLLFCSGLEEKQHFVQRSWAEAEMMGSS